MVFAGCFPEQLNFLYSKCKNPTEKLQMYHDCLAMILQPLKEMQYKTPIMEVMIGKYIRRVKVKVFISAVLGDGKSNDALCTRIRAQKKTLRLSRSCLIPSNESVTGITMAPCWVRTDILEHLMQSAFGIKDTCKEEGWISFLNNLDSTTTKNHYQQYAKRRQKICRSIIEKVFRNHVVKNAFFGIDFLRSTHGIFGHTPTDVMHCLEEGIFKYIHQTILDPLPETQRKQLDSLVNSMMTKNRTHGMDYFSRCNFSNGFSSLSYLSSDERVGAILALLIVMYTDKGREILDSRFHPSFDSIRMLFSNQFKKRSKNKIEINSESDDDIGEIDDEDENENGNNTVSKMFQNNDVCWDYLKRQIQTYGLQYIVTDVIPTIPDQHCWELLQVYWKHTSIIKERDIKLPDEVLDHPSFGPIQYERNGRDFERSMQELRDRVDGPFLVREIQY